MPFGVWTCGAEGTWGHFWGVIPAQEAKRLVNDFNDSYAVCVISEVSNDGGATKAVEHPPSQTDSPVTQPDPS